jgi:hypothetical protein
MDMIEKIDKLIKLSNIKYEGIANERTNFLSIKPK